MTPKVIDTDVKRLHAQGLCDREIAEELHVSPSHVQKVRAGLGLPAHRRGAISAERIETIRAMAAAGKVAAEIAKVLGCDPRLVRDNARRYDITLSQAEDWRAFSPAEDALVIEAMKRGEKQTVIAARLNRPDSSVHSRVKKLRAAGKLPPPGGVASVAPERPQVRAPEPPAPRAPGVAERLAERYGARVVADLVKAKRYAEVSEAAALHRLPISRATALWHQVRA